VYRNTNPGNLFAPAERDISLGARTLRSYRAQDSIWATGAINIWPLCGQAFGELCCANFRDRTLVWYTDSPTNPGLKLCESRWNWPQ
jgi:hypothetical protein